MIGFVLKATRGYLLVPWRSPYLRWRIETYSGMHADQIGFTEFWRFTWKHRSQLLNFLRWAERMDRTL